MTEEAVLLADKELMLHALGCVPNIKKCFWGYRNYFSADKSHYAIAGLERNVQRGWMRVLRPAGENSFIDFDLYQVTRLGMDHLGLSKSVIKRAKNE